MATRIGRAAVAVAVASGIMLRHAAALAGGGAIAYGAWLWSAPLGFVVGGMLLLGGVVLDAIGATRK